MSPREENADLLVEIAALRERVASLTRENTELQEQQTATSEVLKIISRSALDLTVILKTVAETATRLCAAQHGHIFQFDGDVLRFAAGYGTSPELKKYFDAHPVPLGPGSASGLAASERRTIQIDDILAVPSYQFGEAASLEGWRTVLAVPMLKDSALLGTITIWRTKVQPFTDRQIALVETFADQAVIAIENVRLFKELQEKNSALTTAHAHVTESLEQQTATAEILSVISGSPTDVRPVFDAVLDRALTLCEASNGSIYHFEDGVLRHVGLRGPHLGIEVGGVFPLESTPGRAVLEKRTVHLEDILQELDWHAPEVQAGVQRAGLRTVVAVPLLREQTAIGAIVIRRLEVRPFSEKQIRLLKTFADQAVIAIENVRLFTELQEKNLALTQAHAEVTETLEQQTATSEVLRAISGAHTDAQPVFDIISASALRLCGAVFSAMVLYDGEILRLVAIQNAQPEGVEALRKAFPRPLDEGSATSRAIRTRAVVNISDVFKDPHFAYGSVARAANYRSVLAVPMMRNGDPLGVILATRPEPGPFSEKETELLRTFADQAVIAIENVRLFTELQEKNRALTVAHAQVTETLEQQTATSEILRVISSSPTDIQPVFDAIVARATTLCGALFSALFRFDGELLHFVAHHKFPAQAVKAFTRDFPARLEGTTTARAILERRVVNVADVLADPAQSAKALARAQSLGYRSILAVPMFREGQVIGTIAVVRPQVGRFTDKQVELLKTFADQAVIAIENVRLFNETKEALERQTATAEILRVISSSPTDLQPVLDAVASSAARLCEATDAVIQLRDGDQLMPRAHFGPISHAASVPIVRSSVSGQVAIDGRTIHIHDLTAVENDDEFPVGRAFALRDNVRTHLATPLLREGIVLGVILIRRGEVRPFSKAHISLLQTFADQAVIAIENVRLFTELQEKNRALTEAHAQVSESLEQQTATSEILRVISSSPTDVQPVFDAIATNAARLCDAVNGLVIRFDGQLLHLAAQYNVDPERLAAVKQAYPRPPSRGALSGRAILTRDVVHVADVSKDSEYTLPVATTIGYRSVLAVPMMHEGVPRGTILVARDVVAPFSDTHIALIRTFADQAVIAIENVRLFKELESSNRELRVALEQQTATSELLKVIGRSTFDLRPVFETLAENAVRLCEAEQAVVFRFDGQLLRAVITHNLTPENREFVERNPIAPGHGSGAGRAALERRTIHIHDVHVDAEYTYGDRQLPFRTLLAIPMLRADELMGTISIQRDEVRPFTDRQIALLETFADQAAIAIENARLLTELQARTQELTRSVAQLTALGEVGRAVSSTLDLEAVLSTIVSRAIQLSGTDGGSVYEYDEATEEFSLRASRDLPEAYVEQVRDTRPRKGEGAVGRVAQTREPVQIADISDLAAYESRVRQTLLHIGLRALLAVPLIAEDQLVGALIVMRKSTGTFAAEEVTLLQTFATQSALAIQNARLFREIEDKSRQLEVASQHKSEFLANMSHELRTPLNAIIGFSEVLSERMFGELNEKQDEYLKDIYASGTHLLSLINDILDLSKIEAGRMELELSDFHLPQAIENALTLVRERAGRRGIALAHTMDERLGEVRGDERKIKQVLLNLLSNAIKFTPEGGRIEVAAVSKDGLAEVSVSDTGVGIASEDQEKVFEEFRQVGTAEKRAEGTGLGLTLCRKFVELHGGRIWVRSQPGAGSTFTFTIPVRRLE